MGLEAVRTLQGPIMGVDEFLYSLPSPRSECTRRRRPHACGHSQHRHDQAAAERPADGQPPPSHSSVAPPYRTASGRAANLPFAFCSSSHERQQRLSAGPLRKLARTLAYTARRRTATAAGLFGRDAPTNASARVTEDCVHGRGRRGADARHGRGERHASCCTIDPAGRRPIAVCG